MMLSCLHAPATPACRYLTGAIEAVSDQSGLNKTFLGLIILPIAGNACEHITAVFVAMKDKMVGSMRCGRLVHCLRHA